MNDDSRIVVVNKNTGNMVPYSTNTFGEVILVSSDPEDTEDNCIVTTWNEIINLKMFRRDTSG